jgi:hypothetical protein
MGAGLATTPKDKKSTTPSRETLSTETPQSEQSAFTPSGHGSSRGSTSGAASGMPAFLQLQVQMKCGTCESSEDKKCPECEAEEKRRKEDGLPAVQKKCAACEAEGLKANSTTDSARDGVSDANRALPHLDRIQASFGRHDVTGSRAAVGGSAAAATGRMGALAYTAGNRVAFRQEPDLNLAAHEATHVVQQRNGAKLPGGVGRPGDPYEQQADAVAGAVERGESAEPILDRAPSGDSGGSEPGVQHRLEVNATRTYEPASAGSASGMAAGSRESVKDVKSGEASAGGKTRSDTAGGEKEDSKASPGAKGPGKNAPQSGAAGQQGTQPANSPAASAQPQPAAAAPSDAGQNESTPANPDTPAQAGQPGGEPQTEAQPEQSSTPATTAEASSPAPAPDGNSAPPATSGAAPAGQAGATCAPACFTAPKEEPKDKSDDKPPPNPPQGESEAETSAGDEPDLPEPDDCPAQEAQAGVPAAAAGAATSSPQGAAAGGGQPSQKVAPAKQASAAAGGPALSSAAAAPAATESIGSPLDGAIAQGEAQRSEAIDSYQASTAALADASASSANLRSGTNFAASTAGGSEESARREAASNRADRFFADAADELDQSISYASGEGTDQLGAEAESAKAQLIASAETQKDAISARIAAARDQAHGDAAVARRAVGQQADSFVAQAQSGAAGAIATLTAAHATTMGQVDALETSTLDQVNLIYFGGRISLEGLGAKVGGECTAIGEQFATAYAAFETCTEDGFWDGDLSERRAHAQAEAARKTAGGYRDRMVDAAKKRAHEVVKGGRKNNRCAVIASARHARETLDEQLSKLTATLEDTRDHAIQQAEGTRTSLLNTIDAGLRTTLSRLDQQEHEQRQTVDDTCYLQQVMQERIAHAGASSLQRAVTGAASSLQTTLFELRARFAASNAPDPKVLDDALSQVTRKIDAALDGLLSSVIEGAALSIDQLASAGAQGFAALESVTAANDDLAGGISGEFGASMGAISGQDNFASQRAGFSQMMQRASSDGSAALAQAVGGMRDACGKITGDCRKSLTQAGADLEKNLRQSKQGIECQITQEADKAASHEAPAWKRLIAVLLVILVIVIVIAVTILTAGMALGPLAMIGAGILIGAAVGAVTSGLLAMAGNLWSNQDVMKGVGHAVLVGAITGAIGGGIGAGVGLALKSASIVVQYGAAMLTAGVLDAGGQFIANKGSFKNFSWSQLGITLLVTAITLGIAHYSPQIKTGLGFKGGGGGPKPVAEPNLEPAPTSGERPAPTEAKPAEVVAAEPTPAEKAVIENTARKSSEELTPAEATSERDVASKMEGEPIEDGAFKTKKTLPNGHTVEETPEGNMFKRCTACKVFDSEGNPIGEGEAAPVDPAPEEPTAAPAEEPAEPAQEPSPTDEEPAVKKSAKDEAKERLGKVREQQTEKVKEIQELAKERSDAAKKVRDLREKVQASEGPARKQAVEELKQAQEDLRDLEDANRQLYKEKFDLETKETQLQKSLEGGRLRDQYMGDTPGKSSRTGLEVQQRMRAQGTLRDNLVTGEVEFRSAADGNWYPLSDGDMAHVTDAVKWWNETGRAYGPKSAQVREWMLNSRNYTIEHYSPNRSAGAKLPDRYLPPL